MDKLYLKIQHASEQIQITYHLESIADKSHQPQWRIISAFRDYYQDLNKENDLWRRNNSIVNEWDSRRYNGI